ncbi:MAG: 2-oxoacid:acceptor oxidoreductase subunit alpha [Proteobacteria bacterium]|jgi:2-oxoglutarate ferredoxin oxidoreductase subunit alpha|nr:2-oxoacid:acceptor oxidoreductase subunit alpha [Pseudomonadota bacterium]
MKADPAVVATGMHFIDGNEACAEGALAAGCRFVAGYPITPSTEVVEHLAKRFPRVGGMFIQMEDEIASSICFQGAVWAGMKAMTVTSGPGLSLMMEHVGLAAMTECPSVFVDVQRAGPSTGLPTLPAQQDVMQVRWGSHGDYEVIALSPSSPQECFDHAVTCFNLAEKFRCPVFFMMDETVGHMLGKVKIPPADQIEVAERRLTTRKPGEYRPYEIYGGDQPEMVRAGMGHRIHTTGLTHDERGYPAMNAAAQDKLIRRLCSKVLDHVEELTIHEATNVEGSDVTIVAYGITARVAAYAVDLARRQGVKAGLVKLVTLWPFNDRLMRDIAASTKNIIVAEMNLGQMVHEVERAVAGKVPVHLVGQAGGAIVEPEAIVAKIQEVLR